MSLEVLLKYQYPYLLITITNIYIYILTYLLLNKKKKVSIYLSRLENVNSPELIFLSQIHNTFPIPSESHLILQFHHKDFKKLFYFFSFIFHI